MIYNRMEVRYLKNKKWSKFNEKKNQTSIHKK